MTLREALLRQTRAAAAAAAAAAAGAVTRVLLVDDDRQELSLIEGQLEVNAPGRFRVDWRAAYDDGLASLLSGDYDACLVDYRLIGPRTGLDFLKEAKARGARAPIVLLTGLWDTTVDLEAMKAGASDYLVKGQFGPDLLERCLRYAIAQAGVVEALRRSQERYRAIVEGTRAILFQLDARGRIVYVNEAASRVLGLEARQLLGRHVLRFVHPADREAAAAAAVPAGSSRVVELRFRGADGFRGWFGVTIHEAAAGGLSGLALEITERKTLEDMFVQAEKMSAMGFLAAGIAHELNTPLSIVIGSVEQLRAKAVKGKAADKVLKTMSEVCERCRGLVDRMLAFSRKEEEPDRVFDLREAVESALALVEPQARMRCLEVGRSLDNKRLAVRGRRTHVEQLVINLANNAIDAMEEGGRLEILAGRLTQRGRGWARLAVVDTGRGIPPEYLERVREPFFTTKQPGRGTGLGLWLATEIAAKMGGTLSIESAPLKGTTVTVLLPLA